MIRFRKFTAPIAAEAGDMQHAAEAPQMQRTA
jgi:hypothetical protein